MGNAKKEVSRELLIDLAFAIANGETPNSEMDAMRKEAASREELQRELSSYTSAIQQIRSVLRKHETVDRTECCLADEILAAYIDGNLSPSLRDQAETHMAACTYCLRQLVELSDTLSAVMEERTDLFEYVLQLTRKGLRLLTVPDLGFTLHQAQLAPVLGSQVEADENLACIGWEQTFSGSHLHFELTRVNDSHVDLALQLPEPPAPSELVHLNLRSAGQLVQSEPIGASGSVRLNHLDVADYDCELVMATGNTMHFTLRLQPPA